MKQSLTARRIQAVVTVALVALLAYIGMPMRADAQQGITKNEIKIGAFGALTGPIAFIGAGSRDGLKLAAKQINDAGGIHGRKIKLFFEAGTTPAEFSAAARKLVEQEKVFAIIIASGSTGAAAAADYLREKGIVTYALNVATPKYYQPFAANMFSGIAPHAKHFGESGLRMINSWGRPDTVAVVVERLAFHKAVFGGLKRKLEGAKIKIATVQEIDPGARDFTAQLVAIARAKPDVVYVAADSAESGFLIKQSAEKGVRNVHWVVSGSSATEAFPPIAGKAGEGVRSDWLFPHYHKANAEQMQRFEKAWHAHYKNPPPQRPNLYDMSGYNGLYIVSLAIKNAGPNPTWSNVIKAFHGLKNAVPSDLVPGAANLATPETYGPKDIQGNSRLYQIEIKDGRWQVRSGNQYVYD